MCLIAANCHKTVYVLNLNHCITCANKERGSEVEQFDTVWSIWCILPYVHKFMLKTHLSEILIRQCMASIILSLLNVNAHSTSSILALQCIITLWVYKWFLMIYFLFPPFLNCQILQSIWALIISKNGWNNMSAEV